MGNEKDVFYRLANNCSNRLKVNQSKRYYVLMMNSIPTLGILCFGILYVYASELYPGGSQANLESEGFDWINNYWCNLMNEKSMNGEPNPARPISIFAMLVLCLSLTIFFFQFSAYIAKHKIWKRIIKIAGLFSMIFATLIFTKYHDSMTMISSFFGLFVVLGMIKEVYGSKLQKYKISGIGGLLLLGLNNYMYYTTQYIEWLPFIQKVTFLIVLMWMIGLNYELRKKIKTS